MLAYDVFFASCRVIAHRMERRFRERLSMGGRRRRRRPTVGSGAWSDGNELVGNGWAVLPDSAGMMYSHEGCLAQSEVLQLLIRQLADGCPAAMQHLMMRWAARHRWLAWAAYHLRSGTRLRMQCCLLALVERATFLGTLRATSRSRRWR
jgi:hypothetical protein